MTRGMTPAGETHAPTRKFVFLDRKVLHRPMAGLTCGGLEKNGGCPRTGMRDGFRHFELSAGILGLQPLGVRCRWLPQRWLRRCGPTDC